ncbi:hypothetical protein HMPREF1207_01955 [Paenibacillus sp. HGH0039]|nr:hypothetical protein HMPREF1207_01955 [Paenibacillus sp. HGH0039]
MGLYVSRRMCLWNCVLKGIKNLPFPVRYTFFVLACSLARERDIRCKGEPAAGQRDPSEQIQQQTGRLANDRGAEGPAKERFRALVALYFPVMRV